MQFRAAVIQAHLVGVGEVGKSRDIEEANIARMVASIDRLCDAPHPPRLIVFPVLSFGATGIAMRDVVGQRLPPDPSSLGAFDLAGGDARLDRLVAACQRYSLYVSTSCVEKHALMPGRIFHTGFVMGPEGIVLRSPKTQAITGRGVTVIRDIYAEFVATFGLEAVLPVVETPIGKLGCLVETEALIPEAVRTLARKGAEIVICTSAQFAPPGPPYDGIRRALAYFNGVYWLSGAGSREEVVHEGKTHVYQFSGGTEIVGPDGVVITGVEGGRDGCAAATIDLAWLHEYRDQEQRKTEPADIVYQDLFRDS